MRRSHPRFTVSIVSPGGKDFVVIVNEELLGLDLGALDPLGIRQRPGLVGAAVPVELSSYHRIGLVAQVCGA
jgi:hypothetical protein